MNGETKIVLNTKAVKALFPEGSETLAELERNAAEKIAEELHKKVKRTSSFLIEEGIDRAAQQALNRWHSKVTQKYSFPDAARKQITAEVRDALVKSEDLIKQNLASFAKECVTREVGRIKSEINSAASKALQSEFNKMTETMRKLARQEFFKVLEEAKGVS